jgi:hypothetical protein
MRVNACQRCWAISVMALGNGRCARFLSHVAEPVGDHGQERRRFLQEDSLDEIGHALARFAQASEGIRVLALPLLELRRHPRAEAFWQRSSNRLSV